MNSLGRLTDRPDMTIAFYHGRKATTYNNNSRVDNQEMEVGDEIIRLP